MYGPPPPSDQPHIWWATVPSKGGHQPENWTGRRYVLTATSTVTCPKSVRVVVLQPVGGCGIPCVCWLRFPVFLALHFFCVLSFTDAVFPVRLFALSLLSATTSKSSLHASSACCLGWRVSSAIPLASSPHSWNTFASFEEEDAQVEVIAMVSGSRCRERFRDACQYSGSGINEGEMLGTEILVS